MTNKFHGEFPCNRRISSSKVIGRSGSTGRWRSVAVLYSRRSQSCESSVGQWPCSNRPPFQSNEPSDEYQFDDDVDDDDDGGAQQVGDGSGHVDVCVL